MPVVKALYVYPIKSLGGISMSTVQVTKKGFQYDRRWMLVDENNMFLTQRTHRIMATLQVQFTENGLQVFTSSNVDDAVEIPFENTASDGIRVQVWDDICEGILVDEAIDGWFTQKLQIPCKLVYMPDSSLRPIDKRYAVHDNDITSFSDGYPILMISQESLNDLNSRMPEPVPMDRFRPNLVIEGVQPYQEDDMKTFEMNNAIFYGVKPCARCVVTTINQQTLAVGKEPLRTLATYRKQGNNILFGQNVIPDGNTIVTVGDTIFIHNN
jgi:uncharacterized protein